MNTAKEAGLQVHGCFVIGLPGETEKTAQETINFALSLGLTTAQFSGAVPFPGTKLFTMCDSNGWIKTKDWAQWLDKGEQRGVVEYPGISFGAIAKCVDEGLKRFYFRPSYMFRFLMDTRSMSDLYRKMRGAWNFVSYLFGN
jgi:radical SAM superfamily enzyme YgiQ (UPF0313 family)